MAEHEEHSEHGASHYVKIWAVLLALLIVSIVGPVLAPHIESAAAGAGVHFIKGWMIVLITAFGIAIYKAYLVASHFMHLNIEKRYISYLLATMLMLMVLFFAGVSPDIMKHEGTNWTNVAAETEIDRALKVQGEGGAKSSRHEEAGH